MKKTTEPSPRSTGRPSGEPSFALREARYSRRSTKRRGLLRSPGQLLPILLSLLSAGLVVALALVGGNHLKARSDALRADMEAGRWTLDAETAEPIPVAVPELSAVAIQPEGNVGDILIAGKHHEVLLPLTDAEGNLLYTGRMTTAPEGTPSFAEDVARVRGRGLRTGGVFTVTSLTEPDPATAVYRRGLELALLREYAESGVDDLILCGLPVANDAEVRAAYDFLADLKALLADLETPPAVGVLLSPSAFSTGDVTADGDPIYAGSTIPTHLHLSCDFLLLDLRATTPDILADELSRMQYIYVRHSLRLVVADESSAAVAEEHGFERVFQME